MSDAGPVVTLSAPYGAGGSTVGPAVAARLGLPFLDRAISVRVAEQLDVTVEQAEAGSYHRGWLERLAFTMSPFAYEVVAATGSMEPPLDDSAFRRSADAVLREAARDGAVILGRGAAWALRDVPGVLRVRLYGEPSRRVAQAREIEGVDEEAARRRMRQVDEARAEYVRRLYGAKVDDADVYDLQIDSTRLALEAVVDVVVTAARGELH